MARKRLSREESQAQTRRRLLEAARIVFARRGYRGASVEEIAAEAGYSKGAVYSNFESKEDLFLELKHLHMAAEFSKFDGLVAQLGERKATLAEMKEIVRSWLDAFVADTEWFVLGVELQLHARRNPGFATRYGALNERHRAALAAIVSRMFAALGKVPPDNCGEIADALIGVSLGLALESGPSTSAADVMVTMMGSFLAGAPDAKPGTRRSR